MQKGPYEKILIQQCATCRICCHGNVSEGVCGYNTIEMIINEEIPLDYIKKMVVIQVKYEKMDEAARKWWHFPKENILKDLTLPENGVYEFLAVPYAIDNCIFLSNKGCMFPKAKPFDCSMFPFYFLEGKFNWIDWCPLIESIKEDSKLYKYFYSKVLKSTNNYKKFSKKHQKQYYEKLKELKNKINFEIINF